MQICKARPGGSRAGSLEIDNVAPERNAGEESAGRSPFNYTLACVWPRGSDFGRAGSAPEACTKGRRPSPRSLAPELRRRAKWRQEKERRQPVSLLGVRLAGRPAFCRPFHLALDWISQKSGADSAAAASDLRCLPLETLAAFWLAEKAKTWFQQTSGSSERASKRKEASKQGGRQTGVRDADLKPGHLALASRGRQLVALGTLLAELELWPRTSGRSARARPISALEPCQLGHDDNSKPVGETIRVGQ